MENQFNDKQQINNEDDHPGLGWQILAFFVPISGIIMYFNNNKQYLYKAKRYIQLAGFGMALGAFIRLMGRI